MESDESDADLTPGPVPGAVRLAVADPEAQRDFYRRVIGLGELDAGADATVLGSPGAPVVELVAEPAATPRPPGTTGLFHLAILVPDRAELARALRRVASAGRRLSGASDHLVSEALYLSDPEGNGIEIYRDRPPEEWPRSDDGGLQMDTRPLDLQSLLAEVSPSEPTDGSGLAVGTRIGHVHLNVADLEAAEEFYVGRLGFEVTVRGYPGALFVSSGGYHHHVGLNTWAGDGAPQPPPGARGLRRFELVYPSQADLDAAAERVAEAAALGEDEGRLIATDPSGNAIALSA